MDDDVAVLPDAIAKLSKWTDKHEVIQGSRFDYDGGPFYWQYDFIVPLGIPNPIAPAAFGPAGYRVMDTLCFEGGLFSRLVEKSVSRTRGSSSTGTTRCTGIWPARSPTRLWCPTW